MIRIKDFKIAGLLLLFLVVSISSFAQYSSEEELKKAANKFFDEENFVEALPLFSQLLSTYPKDVNYNYKYGACYLFATRDKEKSINYLSFAVSKSTVEPLAYYYMAKAYHHNYEFATAIVYYNKYKSKTSTKEHQKYQIDRQIEMCGNGQKLLKKINKIGVIDKKEIKETEFFRSYDLRGIQGKVIVKPDDFQSKADKKINDRSILFSDPNLNTIVYSSYGDKGTNKDLYKIEKIGVGQFSDPINLGAVINTEFDEDFAFLHPDGKTLYFSSKGHNSMGGYDIFKSSYNAAAGTWSTPVNLDFPINTPDDDVLYISDIDNQLAYFASSRASKQGEMTVYRVKVEPEPVQNPMIKGVFFAEQNPNMKDATISVVDATTNTKLGVYTSDSKSGEYLLTFPKALTKYKLIVETTSDAPIHSAIIELPVQNEFALLKQELILVGEGDNEKLVVKNLFDQVDEFDITNPIIVQNLLKQRAKLEVNTTEEEALSSSQTRLVSDVSTDENSSSLDYKKYSDEQLVTITREKISTLIKKTSESEAQTNFYYNLANEKTKTAKTNYDAGEKTKAEVANDVNQAVVALSLARVSESELTERKSEKQKLENYQSKIASLIDNGKRAEAEGILAEITKIEQAGYFANSSTEVEQRLMQEKLKEKQLNANKQRDVVIELTNRKLELEKSITDLENKLASTKKSKEKEEIQAQIDTYKIDLEDIEFQLNKAKGKEAELNKEYNDAKNKSLIFEEVLAANQQKKLPVPATEPNTKLALERNITYFEEEGIVGYYPTNEELALTNSTTKSTSSDLSAIKDEYKIIDKNGQLIDYNNDYENKISSAQNESDETQRALQIASINQDWIKSIDEDIQIKQYQLSKESDLETKAQLQQFVDKLETLKEQKQAETQEQLAYVEAQNGSQLSDNNSQISIDNQTETSTELANSTKLNQKSQTSNTDNNLDKPESIIDSEGNIIDYNSAFLEELEALPSDEQSSRVFAQKSSIYSKWANATEQELALKKKELAEANEEDKTLINEEIGELETDLQDKEEFAALFLAQAKSLATSDDELAYIYNLENSSPSTNEGSQLTDNASQTSDNNRTNQTEAINNMSQNSTSSVSKENSSSVTNVNSTSPTSTEFASATKSNLNPQTLREVEVLKKEATELRNQADDLMTEANETSSNEEKQNKINESERINKQAEEKELKIASVYERANIAAFNSNENVLTQLEKTYGSNSTDNNFIMAEMLGEEATELFSEAATARKEALSSTDFDTKKQLNEEAYILELKAIEKQEKAILLIDKNNLASELAMEANNNSQSSNTNKIETSNSELETVNNTQISDNNSNNQSETSNNESSTLSNSELTNNSSQVDNTSSANSRINQSENTSNTETEISNNSQLTNNNSPTTEVSNLESKTVYQPKAISIASDEVVADADRIMKEAEVLQAEAKTLEDSLATLRKKKEKEALLLQVEAKKEEANRKIKEADVLYAEAEDLKEKEAQLSSELTTIRTSVVSESFTSQDEVVVNQLSPSAIVEVKSNEEYVEYVELKKETRRLIKDAQVEYIEADKVQEEAKDQVGLGNALRAMEQAASSEADKQKLQSQMKKLEQMIADNEEKAEKLRKEATEKEKKALEQETKATDLLANTDATTSKRFVAIEKAEYYNPNLVAQKMDDAQLADNNSRSTDEGSEPTDNNSRLADNNSQTSENNTQLADNTDNATEPENNSTNQSETSNNESSTSSSSELTDNNTQSQNNRTTNPSETSNVQPEIATNIDEVPEKLSNSIFTLTPANQSAYNNSKQIPKNTKMPEGLVFKVQVGAFRNQIPQDHFKGFAPVMAEDAGNGITRYTAGLFTSFNVANEAKNSIRSIGYPDAFVVAFLNGKRININEARAMLNESSSIETVASINNNNQRTIDNPSNNSQSTTTNNEQIITPSTEEVKDGISKDVRNISGVFYTVQVGVYSKEITSGQLNNLSPINSERTANGLIRYTSGVYTNLNDANAAKDRIRNLGISDAFVIAYQNGKKITVAQATQLLSEGTNSSSENNSQPSNNQNNETNRNFEATNNQGEEINTSPNTEIINETNNSDNSTTNNNTETELSNENVPVNRIVTEEELQAKARALDIVFKVKIGEYEEEVSNEDAAIFLKLSDRGIENHQQGNKTIYTVGMLLDYKSALNLQLEMKEMGVKNPAVVAFEGDEIIPVETAIEKIKNN